MRLSGITFDRKRVKFGLSDIHGDVRVRFYGGSLRIIPDTIEAVDDGGQRVKCEHCGQCFDTDIVGVHAHCDNCGEEVDVSREAKAIMASPSCATCAKLPPDDERRVSCEDLDCFFNDDAWPGYVPKESQMKALLGEIRKLVLELLSPEPNVHSWEIVETVNSISATKCELINRLAVIKILDEMEAKL